MESLLVRPHLPARSTRDLNRSLLAGVLVLLQLLAAPVLVGGLAYLVTRSWFGAYMAATAILPLLAVTTGLHAVGWLRLDASGITFGRRMGRPGRLQWTQITCIRPAAASEVIRQGWLWPALFPREASRSLTSEGHYRIECDGRFCFFPPDDEQAFRSAVERWAPGVLSPEAHA